ncbi:hypothetical protein NDU88_003338 [Pleurodeles waltl]|uniref:Uncharacterized protein n=1 Tax=Pleurodeles waltl TaxID=8319 RepID=A0AAV7UY59_PLEWA|nr:hypothetical protein NDU88_003338 [Pleurodeles waltl]
MGPAGTPEPKLTGEALLGPVESQTRALQGIAGWRKGVPAPGPSGGPAGAPESKLAEKASPGVYCRCINVYRYISSEKQPILKFLTTNH